ncbi:MAG: DUF6134 family protein [Pseudomonadota bacterium]
MDQLARVRRVAFGICAASVFIGAGAEPAPSTPQLPENAPDQTLHYKIFRKGKSIGNHHVTVTMEGDDALVDVSFAIRVKFLGVTAFRMDHSASERWALSPRTLKMLSAVTDRSSGTYEVTLDAIDEGYEMRVNGEPKQAPDEVVPTSFTLANHLFTDTNTDVVLLDTLSGILRPSRIHFRGLAEPSDYQNATGSVRFYEITRLDTGETTHKMWFDEEEAFLKVGLKTKDGYYVEYRRQTTPT